MSHSIKVVNAIPVNVNSEMPIDANNIIILPNENNKIYKCLSYSYSVKIISCIQIFFNVLSAFYNPYLLFHLLFSIYGYYGAKIYNKCLSYIYFIYTFMSCISELFLLYYANNQQFPSYESRIFTNLIFILILLCNIYILKIIYKFIHSLKQLNDDELAQLKKGRITLNPVFSS